MQVNSSTRIFTQVRLDKGEGWEQYNEEGYPFWVDTVNYQGGSSVLVEGYMIKVDRSQGVLKRRTSLDIAQLPAPVFLAMRADYKRVIIEMHDTIRDAAQFAGGGN